MKAHTTRIRVRYGETDRMGVVYNAHFLDYFEVGRTEFLRAAGTAYRELEERGIRLVVTEAHCRYLGPARYDDVLALTTWVSRLRPTRVDFRTRVTREGDGAPVAQGHVVLACLDSAGRPRALPADVRRVLDVSEGGCPPAHPVN